jgi:hypothetical protein
MDEALRRAYLAAMDIPVWIPRSEPDPFAETVPLRPAQQLLRSEQAPPVSAPAPAQDGPLQAARPGRGQAMLGEKPAETPRRAVQPAASATDDRLSFSFGFVCYGSTLLIDEGALSQRGEELARAICFAVERTKRPVESQDFSWPPRGAPFVAAEARDAMLARIDKFGGDTLARVLLLGEAPASVLMGWDAAQWAGRTVGSHHIEGIGCAAVLLPGLVAMLSNPDAKRVAWQHLRTAGPGNA